MILLHVRRGLFEHLLLVSFGSNAHEFLTGVFVVELLGMRGNICSLELIRQWYLVQLQLVDSAIDRAEQSRRSGDIEAAPHDWIQMSDESYWVEYWLPLVMITEMRCSEGDESLGWKSHEGGW